MIPNLLVFLLAALVWVAALWLAIAPNFSQWPNIGVAAVHVLPPVFITMLWLFYRWRVQQKLASDAQSREEQAHAERKAARDAAIKKHEEEMQQRRFGCDCRMVVFSRLGLASPLPVPEPDQPNIDIRPVWLEADAAGQIGPILERLEPEIAHALSAIYSTCRAAIAFPIYVQPPSDLSGEEVLTYVRATHSALAEELAPEMNRIGIHVPILFLPASDSVAGRVLSIFEVAPDLPGAVILSFDSPVSRASCHDDDVDDELDRVRTALEQVRGKPSEAVVAMLTTNAHLDSMLAAISHVAGVGAPDAMTPFWEKAIHAGGRLEALSWVDRELQEELSDLPVLGRVHRAATRPVRPASTGVLELTRVLQHLLEQAQINAGVIEPPFAFSDSPPDENTSSNVAGPGGDRCGAIVHNAGSVDVAGKRLAALGGALYYFDIDLSPVDEEAVLNVVTRTGDLGCASGIAQLALSLVHAAQKAAPALCAEFRDDESIAASFVMPAATGMAEGQV